ncbi:MAG: putative glycoside hydrolase [Phycisphaerae bacterium]
MKRTAFLVLAALLPAPLAALHAADALPPFSWHRVPVYAHVGKSSGDFTSEQLDFLAKHFGFIAVEKGQSIRKRGDTEAGIAEAARQIKRRNPRAKVLFYWNTFLDYPLYKASRSLPADWHLKNRERKPLLVRNSVPAYDLTRADMRAWWSNTAVAAVRNGAADGIFADALLQVTAPGKRKLLGDEKYRELNNGLVAMLKETRRKLGPDATILYNGLRGRGGAEFLPLASGAMIEHFGHFSGVGKEKMAEDLDAMSAAARAGKIVCLKAWPGFSWQDAELMRKPHTELVRLARERLVFPLACFLVAAESNCYFCYTWGYRETDGTFDWYPEFDKPLGPPEGKAKRTGWTYHRGFAHAAVSVDLEAKTARIDWQP